MAGTRFFMTLIAISVCSFGGGHAIRPTGILRLPGDEGRDFTGKRRYGARNEALNTVTRYCDLQRFSYLLHGL